MKNNQIVSDQLSIVLVNYKTPEMTRICLELLEKAVDVTKVPVWVVDNDSNDASLDYLKSLSWVKLLERKTTSPEVGFMAHGRALDMAMEQVDTDFVLLMHTDTLIYSPKIIDNLLEKMREKETVAAVGCLEQVERTALETAWRVLSRAVKYYMRRVKRALGIKTRDPRLYYEIYLKSFCTLWNANIIKQNKVSFAMVERTPGYEMQDILKTRGYEFVAIPPRKMFQYMDHIEAGTVALVRGLGKQHKRVKNAQAIIKKNTIKKGS
jgi:glycosyltransferase involved in cell wall biosynthesis